MSRAALHIGTGVQQNGALSQCRNGHGQCGSVHARQHPKSAVRSEKRRSSVAGTEKRRRLALGHNLCCSADGGTGFLAESYGRRLPHPDDVRGIDDPHVDLPHVLARNLVFERGSLADERDAETQVAGRHQRAINDIARPKVATGGVNGYVHRSR